MSSMNSLRSVLGLGDRTQTSNLQTPTTQRAPRRTQSRSERQVSQSGFTPTPTSPHHATTQHRQRDVAPQRSSIPRPITFSQYSTPAVPNSMWFAHDFMVGAGMVVIQPSSGKVLLLHEPAADYWFFPKGRKDIGETIEQAALREAYEESGYRVAFLPLLMPSNAPCPPGSPELRSAPSTEPLYVTTTSWKPRQRPAGQHPRPGDNGGEYLTFWYVGQIPADAVYEPNTGMPDEQGYQSYLMDFQEARRMLEHSRMHQFTAMLLVAYDLWQSTQEALQQRASAQSATERPPNAQ